MAWHGEKERLNLYRRFQIGTFCAIFAIGLTSSPTTASVVDLTAGVGASGTINTAVFEFMTVQSGGTGVIAPFVRIQRNGDEQGYNTSAAVLPFDEKSGAWTHDLQIGEIQVVMVSGVDYYEFQLDINEPSGGNKRFLSLDEVQIYTSPIGSQNTTTLATLGTLRYDLDAVEESHVLLDSSNTSGSGEMDMRMLVPAAHFAGAAPADFVYVYSQFGLNESSNGGFEEWRVRLIPEPAAGLLAFAALALFSFRRSRSRSRSRRQV